ncbi:hypothetical protein HAX54_006710, partial [Datura stramonium]|nr:hypothetical protein [Datura stramonium]
ELLFTRDCCSEGIIIAVRRYDGLTPIVMDREIYCQIHCDGVLGAVVGSLQRMTETIKW